MDKEKIEYFREILKERFEEILTEAEKTVSGMTTANENFPDPTDRASLESDRNFMLRIRDRERKLLSKIRIEAPWNELIRENSESVRLAATISGRKD